MTSDLFQSTDTSRLYRQSKRVEAGHFEEHDRSGSIGNFAARLVQKADESIAGLFLVLDLQTLLPFVQPFLVGVVEPRRFL